MDLGELIRYGFMQRALIAGTLIATLCAILGVFLVLRRFSLIGDGLAHVTFGGVAVALLLRVDPAYTAVAAIPVVLLSSLGILKLTESLKRQNEPAHVYTLLPLRRGTPRTSAGPTDRQSRRGQPAKALVQTRASVPERNPGDQKRQRRPVRRGHGGQRGPKTNTQQADPRRPRSGREMSTRQANVLGPLPGRGRLDVSVALARAPVVEPEHTEAFATKSSGREGHHPRGALALLAEGGTHDQAPRRRRNHRPVKHAAKQHAVFAKDLSRFIHHCVPFSQSSGRSLKSGESCGPQERRNNCSIRVVRQAPIASEGFSAPPSDPSLALGACT